MENPSNRPSSSTSGGNNHGLSAFPYDGRNPFKQDACNLQHQAFVPRNAFQISRFSDSGSFLASNSTCQAHAKGLPASSIPFKDALPSFMDSANKHEPKAPLHQFGGGSLMMEASQSGVANSLFGPAPHSAIAAARAPRFASEKGQTAPSFSSAPSFSFGNAPSIAATGKQDEPRIPFQRPSFTNFSSSPKPEAQNVFLKSLAQGGSGTSDFSWSQKESLSSRGSGPTQLAPPSPFAPASPREYSFWRPSAPAMRIEDKTFEFSSFSGILPNQTIPLSEGQNVIGPVSTSPFLVLGPTNGSLQSGQNASMPPFSVFGPSKGPLQSGISKPGFNKSSTSGGSLFSPFSNGASLPEEIIDSMEDENVVSVSAMPSYENISPEELRWQDYQAKKTDSTFVCKFCKEAGSLIRMPSLESSGNDGVTTLSGLIQPNNVSGLDWPHHSLQLSACSIPTVQPCSPLDAVEQNTPVQMPFERATTEMVPKFSNTMHSSARVGISSLPDTGKSPPTRSISLVAAKRVSQKTVIRMQARRHGSCKQDGPRVSFLNDYMD